MNVQNTYIAGWKTVEDWRKLRQELIENGSEEIWEQAYKDYFLERLNLRYLHPIEVLQENGTFQGEGFSIMAILCTLVEFLESTYQGLQYRYLRKHEKLEKYEYSSSKEIFIGFFSKRHPFNQEFDDELAAEFYESIRCGLLHEAQTKNGWKIWAVNNEEKLIDKDGKIVYRDNLKDAFQKFIDDYKSKLKKDKKLQKAFIRKFDSLCE